MGLEGYQGSQLSDGLSTCLITTGWGAVFDSNPIPVQPSLCSDLQTRPTDHKVGKNVHCMIQTDFILSLCLLVAFPTGSWLSRDCRRRPLDVWLWIICMQISNYKGAFLYVSLLRRHFHRAILLLLASSLLFFIWRSSLSSPLTSAFQ